MIPLGDLKGGPFRARGLDEASLELSLAKDLQGVDDRSFKVYVSQTSSRPSLTQEGLATPVTTGPASRPLRSGGSMGGHYVTLLGLMPLYL